LTRTSCATQPALGAPLVEADPPRFCQPSKELQLTKQDIPDTTPVHSNKLPHISHTHTTGNECQCEFSKFKARGPDFDITKELLQSLNKVLLSNNLAQEAAQEESAYTLDVSERLIDYIKQVQERDLAHVLLTRWEAGAAKTDAHWVINPNGVLRRKGKV
jgi:hypothetical protein